MKTIHKKRIITLWGLWIVLAISVLLTYQPGFKAPNIGAIGTIIVLFILWPILRKLHSERDLLSEDIETKEIEIRRLRSAEYLPDEQTWRASQWKALLIPSRLQRLRTSLLPTLYWFVVSAFLAVTLLLLGVIFVTEQIDLREFSFTESSNTRVLGLGLLFYSPISALWSINRFLRMRHIRSEIQRLELEFDLGTNRAASDVEERAERLFRANQINLEQYYAINLLQNRIAFIGGIFCIGAGILVAIYTMNVLKQPLRAEGTMIAITGAASTIMVNVVAAIIIAMQRSVGRDLNDFHRRLVATSDIFLANVIAARLPEAPLKQDTLARMALAMAEREARDSHRSSAQNSTKN